MDAETLARIQFAFTVGFHFIFVPISIGLGVMLVIAERRYYKSGLAIDKAMSEMWKKIFAATFAIGVATGISMEFAFGTNWASYSRFVGDIFGVPLAAEGLIAFFLESVFLGVLLLGRDRVSKRLYYASAWIVVVAAHLSALWIIIANSWMQTPAGYKIGPLGIPRLTDFFAAALNHSTVVRYFHVIAATWVAGAFVVAAVCGFYLLRGRDKWMVRRTLGSALVIGLIATIAMPLTGDRSAKEVTKYQPAKLAAFEGLYQTRDDAPIYLFGWVDTKNQKVTGVGIPGGLSFLAHGSPSDDVTGLVQAAPNASDRPPEQIVFQSYHLMVAIGMLMLLIMLVALVEHVRGKLEQRRWLQWVLALSFPLPFIAITLGWVAAEVGRQPWIVQGLMKTKDAVSPTVSAGTIGISLTIFALLYLLLFVAWVRVVAKVIGNGPQLEQADQPAGSDRPGPAPIEVTTEVQP
jgi:cytochrome d ubiquinol oxidase subunit I